MGICIESSLRVGGLDGFLVKRLRTAVLMVSCCGESAGLFRGKDRVSSRRASLPVEAICCTRVSNNSRGSPSAPCKAAWGTPCLRVSATSSFSRMDNTFVVDSCQTFPSTVYAPAATNFFRLMRCFTCPLISDLRKKAGCEEAFGLGEAALFELGEYQVVEIEAAASFEGCQPGGDFRQLESGCPWVEHHAPSNGLSRRLLPYYEALPEKGRHILLKSELG